jgi:Cys-rich repeat protein
MRKILLVGAMVFFWGASHAAAEPCRTSLDCRNGGICVGGRCIGNNPNFCRNNSECPRGTICRNGRCVGIQLSQASKERLVCEGY